MDEVINISIKRDMLPDMSDSEFKSLQKLVDELCSERSEAISTPIDFLKDVKSYYLD